MYYWHMQEREIGHQPSKIEFGKPFVSQNSQIEHAPEQRQYPVTIIYKEEQILIPEALPKVRPNTEFPFTDTKPT